MNDQLQNNENNNVVPSAPTDFSKFYSQEGNSIQHPLENKKSFNLLNIFKEHPMYLVVLMGFSLLFVIVLVFAFFNAGPKPLSPEERERVAPPGMKF